MLVALLSSIEPVDGNPERSRAYLGIAGQSVLARQARLALALGAERVICLAQGLPPQLIAVQHLVEREGMKFHAVAGSRALAGLVTVADEIIAFADGMLIDPAIAHGLLSGRSVVLAVPAETAVPHGFERIDRDRAWAGALRVPAAEVDRLNELPTDIDPISALMRIAVQRGRRVQDVSPDVLTDRRIALIASDEAAREASRRAVENALPPASWSAPAHAVIDRGVRATAADLLAKSAIGPVLGLGMVALAAIAVAAAWNGAVAAALGSLAAVAGLARFGRGLVRVGNAGRSSWAGHVDRLCTAGIDLMLLGVVLIATPRSAWGRALFLLAIMLGLARLADTYAPPWLRYFAQDRVTLLALLSAGAAVGLLGATFQALALFLLAALLLTARSPRITRA